MTQNPLGESHLATRVAELEAELEQAQRRIALLEAGHLTPERQGSTVSCPEAFLPVFSEAERLVRQYFEGLKLDPSRARLEIHGERYLLVRASTLSYDFFRTVQKLYADRGEREASIIGNQLLFDVAHVMGREDARNFHAKAGLTDPIQKLAAGPVMFAYSGWAYVELLPECNPVLGDDYLLVYHHPFSFEASSWIEAKQDTEETVCIMNSGYSSGWCQESFGLELTAVEISCRARGDDQCTFVMAPPGRVRGHAERVMRQNIKAAPYEAKVEIPTFFGRKQLEEEREAARHRAEELSASKSTFLANMSHEIRTPLNAVLGYVELALQDTTLPAEHRSHLSTVKDNSQHLLRLLSDIMDLSRIEASQVALLPEAYRAETLFDALGSFARPLISGSDIALQLVMEPTRDITFRTDATRLKQVLVNLISNAIKFTESGSVRVELRIVEDGKRLRFSVKDTGCGIPLDKQGMIFEVFSQIDGSMTRRQHGAGLGLAIAQGLVMQLGGSLAVTSEPGEGSEFFFSIPYIPDVSVAPDVSPTASGQAMDHFSRAIRVLVAEDNDVNRRLAATVLMRAGCEVDEAADGQAAVDMACSDATYDILLMDVQMPMLDGLRATRIIRAFEAEHGRPRLPIVALTAQAMRGDMQKCLEAGCDDYLAKPFILHELTEMVHRHIVRDPPNTDKTP